MGAGRDGEVNRRLIIRPGAIGDFIVSCLPWRALGATHLEVWTASAHVPLVRFAARARAIAATGLDLLGITTPDPRLLGCSARVRLHRLLVWLEPA